MAKAAPSKNSLLARMLENSTIKTSSILNESEFFNNRDQIPTDVYALNIALSGSVFGGLTCGSTVFAGESKHFKTGMGLQLVAAYLKKYPEGVCIYYDSEHGSTPAYVEEAGVDTSRVIHSPIMNLEQLKFDCSRQLDNIERGDKVIFFVDSLGNLASKKEATDAIDGKDKADLSRAKEMKSFFRIITPYLNIKDVPMVAVAHTYSSHDFIPKTIISGGTGILLSANNAFIVTRAQEKDGEERVGWKFTLMFEKSRFCKEKMKIPVVVTHEEGVQKYSGLLDLALESGHVKKLSTKPITYERIFSHQETGEVIPDTKQWTLEETNSSDFWETVLHETDFNEWIGKQYKLGG